MSHRRGSAGPVLPGRGARERGALALMADRTFGALFWGKLLVTAGVWMQGVAAAVVVYEGTGSATAVSVVSVAISVPQLVLGPFAGTWADRGDPVRQIVLGRVLCLLGATGLAVFFALGGDEPPFLLPVVFACSLLVGFGFVVGGPALQSLVPDLVTPGELHTAMALNTAPLTTARIAGPALGALLLGWGGPALTFAVGAGTHVAFLALLLLARFPARRPVEPGTTASVRAGLAYLRRRPRLVLMLLATALLGIGAEPTLTLAPPLAASFGGGAELAGSFTLAFGLGALLGLVVGPAARRRTSVELVAAAGLLVVAVGIALVATAPTPLTASAALALAGVGFSMGMAGFSALLQAGADRAYRGRVMAWWLIAFVGSRPLASAVSGLVADAASVQAAFGTTGAGLLLAAVVVALVLRRQAATAAAGSPGIVDDDGQHRTPR